MAETKLEKVNKRLYHEPYKDGKPFKWEKRLCWLPLTLTEIRVDLRLEIERPETSFSLLQKDMERDIGDGEKAEHKNATESGEKEEEKYSEDFGWRITATGHLDDRIGVIRKDGTVTSHTEHFDRVDVILRPVSDTDKVKTYGSFFYSDAKWEMRTAPYLCLELLVPETRLEKLCNEFVSGRFSALQVGVHVDVFQSEVDRGLWQPPMRQQFYIEEDVIFNRAYLSRLAASQSIVGRTSGAALAPDNPRELFETEGFSEQKVNFIGKWLLDVADGFKNILRELRNTIVVLAIIYLAWKFFTWIFFTKN